MGVLTSSVEHVDLSCYLIPSLSFTQYKPISKGLLDICELKIQVKLGDVPFASGVNGKVDVRSLS